MAQLNVCFQQAVGPAAGMAERGQSHSTPSGLQPCILKEGGSGVLGLAVPIASLWALPGCQTN